VKFALLVDIGGSSIAFWSARRGETSDLHAKIKVTEIPGYVVLTWTGGTAPRVVEVPLSNVTQIEREPAQVAVPPVAVPKVEVRK
jgi:hypothetical protein